MGFLTKAAGKEDRSSSNSDNEEQYERLFPKIGRDFVHRKDFENMMQQVFQLIDPFGLSPVNFSDDSEARKRALEYKQFLDDQKDGSKVYKDLIKLEDEEEEEDDGESSD